MQTLDDVLLAVIVLAGVIFVPWVFLIRPWLRRRMPSASTKAPERAPVVDLAARRPATGWSVRGELARLFLVYDDAPVMSNTAGRERVSGRETTDLANDRDSGLHPLAMQRKGANDALALGRLGDLAANDLGDITPAEARAIIRQQARAEAIAAILRAAEAGKVKSAGDAAGLIEAVAGGARTSRPGTPYTLLKAAVDELRGKPKTEYVGDMIERVQREVAEQH